MTKINAVLQLKANMNLLEIELAEMSKIASILGETIVHGELQDKIYQLDCRIETSKSIVSDMEDVIDIIEDSKIMRY